MNPQEHVPQEPVQPKKILWEGMQWHSTARNWKSEYRKRIQNGISNPFVNPHTKCVYSIPAQNTRDPKLIIEIAPK